MDRGPWGRLLFFFLGAWGIWIFHRSEFLSAFDLVPGGIGDPQMVVAILEHLHRALRSVGDIRDLPFYYPARDTWGYSDGYLSHLLLYEPLRVLGMGPFKAFQVCVLAFHLLDYLACFLLLRKGLDLDTSPASFGAFLFAFNAVRFNQAAHAQLQASFWLPLAALALVLLLKGHRTMGPWRVLLHLAAAGMAFHLQLLTAYYSAWFLLLWVFLLLGIGLCLRDLRKKLWEFWEGQKRPILCGAVFFLLGFLPFLWLYLPVRLELGGKAFGETASLIPPPTALLWMGPRHHFWGWLWEACPTLRSLPVEGETRIGWGMSALLGWLFLNYRLIPFFHGAQKGKKPKGLGLGWGLAAVLATDLLALLSLRWGDWMPWKFVWTFLPGAEGIRAVSRSFLAMALPLSILFSLALQGRLGRILPGRPWVRLLLVLWAGGVALEQTALPPSPAFSRSVQEARLSAMVGVLPRDTGAFYLRPAPGLPLDPAHSATQLQIDAMLLSAWSGVPTLNGYSGQSPKGWGLYKVRSPNYPAYVRDWVAQRKVLGKIVEVEVER